MAVEVVMPRLSDSMEEGTVLLWLVAEGEEVRRGQPIVEIETDKATMTYDADADGVLLRIVCAAGETAPLGATIAMIGEPGELAPEGLGAEPAAPPAPTDPISPEPDALAPATNGGASGRIPASPVARRTARALGVDLAAVLGTGPNGRVVRADVEAAALTVAPAAPVPPAAPAAEPAASPAPAVAPSAPDTGRGTAEVTALSRLQKTIARRMAESRATVPEFELRVDVDMGAAVELRERLRELGADPLPSYNDMVVMAAARCLREFPRVNGAYRDGVIETYPRINVGVAVAADDALIVPSVVDADRKSLGDIARTTRALAAKVRDGSVTPAELAGGTFTVSNLGMFGIDSFNAVINTPQAAILAVGALAKRPVVADDDEIVVRPMMTLTLACDHRVLYGADGARFLARLRELLEQPLSFVL
jgi:pyruvate dehydrogenase E2 component (dihydrolipoamide acetyltransferase)